MEKLLLVKHTISISDMQKRRNKPQKQKRNEELLELILAFDIELPA